LASARPHQPPPPPPPEELLLLELELELELVVPAWGDATASPAAAAAQEPLAPAPPKQPPPPVQPLLGAELGAVVSFQSLRYGLECGRYVEVTVPNACCQASISFVSSKAIKYGNQAS
jgi:hypothetical protein